jgi:hypothetical protein
MLKTLVGYHSTTLEAARAIVAGNFDIRKVQEDRCWFGKGVYFFQDFPALNFDGLKEAKNWSKKVKKQESCGVIKATISGEKCLDLISDEEDIRGYRQCCDALLKKYTMDSMPEERFREHAVFEFMRAEDELEFAIVPADGGRAKRKYPAYRIDRFQVQIAVYDVSCLKSREIVFETMDWGNR